MLFRSCKSFSLLLYSFSFYCLIVANLSICCVWAVKKCPKLKRRYKRNIEAATEYAKTIDDFDDLVDPRTLARHCLGPEPSSYVLRTIGIKEKSNCSFGSSLTRISFFPSSFSFFLSFFFFFTSLSSTKITTKFNQEMYAKMGAKRTSLFPSSGRGWCVSWRRGLSSLRLPSSLR